MIDVQKVCRGVISFHLLKGIFFANLAASLLFVPSANGASATNSFEQEWAKLKKAGMEIISFSPADSKWLIATLYKAEWDDQMKKLPPDVGPKLRSLLSK